MSDLSFRERTAHDPSKCPWAGCVDCRNVEAERDRYRALLVRCRAELDILSGYAIVANDLMRELREALEGTDV